MLRRALEAENLGVWVGSECIELSEVGGRGLHWCGLGSEPGIHPSLKVWEATRGTLPSSSSITPYV